RRRARSSRTTGSRGTTGRSCSSGSPARSWRSSTPARRRLATPSGWPGPTPPRSLRRSSPQPGLRPEEAEGAVDERLGEVGGDFAGPVREEALAVVVEAGDLGEAGLLEQALEPAGRVAHLGDAVLVARVAALEAVLPVRFDEQETPAGAECSSGGREHEVCVAAVMQGVVEQRRVEALLEVERLHVGDVELGVDAFLGREFAGDHDHLRCDVVAVGVETVSGGEAGHPAGAAAETLQAVSNRLLRGYFGATTFRFRDEALARLDSCS